jgi:hypothetical protein
MPPLPSPPVLLIFFNRADCAAQTLAAVRAARPARLYLATDAPRPHVPEDAARCAATRAAVEAGIDWPCTVQRDYAAANLGPDRRVTSAISWFFDREENGLVLEEDCVPHATFFPFCAELLARYASDERVGVISGDQFVPGGWRCAEDASYAFTQLTQIWGWASWRRAWRLLDGQTISHWPEARRTDLLRGLFTRDRDRRYWRDRFDECHAGRAEAWDYRWSFARWRQGQCGIVPAQNLVTYIGFRPDALHTTGPHPAANLPAVPMTFPLRHPGQVAVDRQLDIATARILFSTGSLCARAAFRLGQLLRTLSGRFRR